MQGLRLGTIAGRRFLAAISVQVLYPPPLIVSPVSDICSPGLAFIVPLLVINFGCHPYPSSMIYVR